MSIIPKTIKASMFFRLEEIYKECCEYAILHLCSIENAQIAVIGEVIFGE